MELIGFRHTREDIERIKSNCDQQKFATIKKKKNARKRELIASIISSAFFLLSAYIVFGVFSSTVFPCVKERVFSLHKEYGFPFRADVYSSLMIYGACLGFLAAVILLHKIFKDVFGLKKYFHIHTEYDDWFEYYCECNEILSYYDNEYQMLMECSDYGARLNEQNNVVFDSVDKDSGLPREKQIYLSQELRDHIFANGTITFEYYDGRLDEIEQKLREK